MFDFISKRFLAANLLVACFILPQVKAQLFQQDFSSSTTVSSYASATPNNGQWNAVSTSGAGTVVSINTTGSNKLRFARAAANAGAFSRISDFSPVPTSMLYRFDITISGNSAAQTNGAIFQVGSAYGTANVAETNANTHSRWGVNWTATAGQFSLRDVGASVNTANFSGIQTVLVAINNSGGTLTYKAPDGTYEDVANDTWDLWIGTSKELNNRAATTAAQTLADLKFVINNGTATIDIDNILINPIPVAPTANAATAIGSGGFTANWSTVAGATGYRLDVSTSSTFASFVSGYENLAVSGTSQVVSGLASATDYYYRVRTENGFTVGTFTSNHSNTQSATTTSSTPTITLSSPAQTTFSDINQSSTNNIISHFQAAVTVANATLNSLAFTTTGTHLAGDLTGNFKLLYGTSNVFGSATQIATVAVGAPGARTFTGFTQGINSGVTGYFWIVVDASGTSGGNRTLAVSANPTLTFASGTPTGSIAVGGTKTFIDPSTPNITVGTITAFGNQCINTTSTERNYSVSGSNLTANIVITPPVGYQISLTSGSGFVSNPTTLSLTPSSGTVSPTTIYVRFVPTSAIVYNANISHTSTGATTQNVAASGTGISGTPSVTTVTATSILTTTASSGGNTLSTTCGTITDKGVVWGTSVDPTIISNLGITNNGTGTGDFTSSITGLTAGTTYNYRAYATNSNGITSYGTNLTFTTLSLEPTTHAASFSVTSPTSASLTLNFSAASTITNAAGYLIIRRTGAAPTGTPTDATGYSVGNTIGDGTVAAIINSTATTSTVISGLASSTNYHFRLIPFGYNGSNAASYNYYVDPTIPSANGTTLSAPVTIVTFPSTWSGTPASAPSVSQNANINGTVTVTRGAGLGAVSSGARFNSDGFSTSPTLTLTGNTDYLTFTVNANSGFAINLAGAALNFTLGSSASGPVNYAVYSSVEGFASTAVQIGPNLTTASTSVTFPNTLAYNNLTSVEFRIYGFNASLAGGTGGFASMNLTGNLVSLGTITTGTVSTSICAGATGVSVPFTYSPAANFPSGVAEFTAQLSNASGSFATPTVLQSETSDGTGSQSITVTIPSATVSGTGYRIRVVSTAPNITGSNNGSNITIQNTSTSIAPIATQNLNPSVDGSTLTVTEGATVTGRQWAYGTTSGGPYSNNLGTATTQIPNFATPGTYYIVSKSTYGAPCSITIESNEVQINVTVDPPTVSTTAPSAINENSAESGGNVTNDGGASITERGVVWATSTNPALPSLNSTSNGTGTGSYSSSFSGLDPETLYYIRAYATNSAGTSYGSNISFLTWSNAPTVQANNMAAAPVSANQIDITWDEAIFPTSGATQKRYVLLRAVDPAVPTLTSANGTAPAAGVGVIVSSTITDPASTFSNTGLAGNTTYNYLLVPYCWDGTNPETYHYLTVGAPTASATTLAGACTKPTVQVSSPLSGSVTTSSALISWASGNGDRTIVIVKQGSAATNEPIDGVTYTANANFGAGTSMGSNEFVCYIGTGNNFTVGNLASSTNYHYAIYTFNNVDKCYLNTGAAGNFTTGFAASIIETFETGVKATYPNGNANCVLGEWNFNDALVGTATDDRKVGSRSARLQNTGSITMLFNKTGGLGTVNIQHARFGSDAISTWRMEVSNDGGATFSAYQSPIVTTSTTNIATTATFTVNLPGDNLRIRIVKLTGGTARLNIDQVSLGNFALPNTITTGVITGSPFCISNTDGLAVNVPFTSVGVYNPTNVYTAQLSDASGNFAIPTNIGTLASAANSGTISAEIPAGTAGGTGYRIRVVSSSPVITGTQNSTNLTIFLNAPDVTGFNASINTSTSLSLGWTNPTGCFDQILIVGRAGSSVTAVPTGDGILYTASAAFGGGTSSDNLPVGEFAIYKNTAGTSVNVTGLTTGTTYFFRIFTRRGTLWSDGAIVAGTPVPVNTGDFRSNVTVGNYNAASTWQTFNGTSWVAASGFPAQSLAAGNPGTVNVTIRTGHTVTLTASQGNQAIRNLTVESGGKIFCNDSTYNGNRYMTIYGDISCRGIIGNGFNRYDNISFNMEGNPTVISGTGQFNGSRIRKNFTTNQATNLLIAMNVGLKFGSGVFGSSGTVVYNAASSSSFPTTFDITINENTVVNLFTSVGASGNISIDGLDGQGTNERRGKVTVNGTLNVNGTLFALTNNLTQPVAYEIGTSGVINCVNVCTGNTAVAALANGSDAGGCTFRILNGGKLNMTGGQASDPNTYNKPFSKRTNTGSPFTFDAGLGTVNNTYDFQPGSIVQYSSTSGAMPIQSQNVTYSNLLVTGAATKTINTALNVTGNITIESPGVLQSNNNSINIGGNWNSYGSGGFTEGTSTVTFNGAGAQSINVSAAEDFYNLVITNNSTDGVELNGDVMVANSLDLSTDGHLKFGATPNTLTLSNMSLANSFIGGASSIFDIDNAAHTLVLGCTAPAFGGVFNAGTLSTTIYNRSSAITLTDGDQIVQNLPYANLTLAGTDEKILPIFTTANGSVRVEGSTTTLQTPTANSQLNLGGNFTLVSDAGMAINCFDNLQLITTGDASQILYGGGRKLRFLSLESEKSAGGISLAGGVESNSLRLKTDIRLNYTGTAEFADNGDTLFVGDDVLISGTGATNFDLTGTLWMNGVGVDGNLRIANFAGTGAAVAPFNNVVISTGANVGPDKVVAIYPADGSGVITVKGNLEIVQGANSANLDAQNNGINLGGNWLSYGENGFIEGTTSRVIFDGTASQSITVPTKEVFARLTWDNANTLTMIQDIDINTNLTVSQGSITTGSNKITLSPTATIIESDFNNVLGVVETTRNLSLANHDFGGLGIEIDADGNVPGSTFVRRTTGTEYSNVYGHVSILRNFTVIPTTNTGLNATMVYRYFDSELNSRSKGGLVLFRSTDGGAIWTMRGGNGNQFNNEISLSGINAFSEWTAAENELPLPLVLGTLSGKVVSGKANLQWFATSEGDMVKEMRLESSLDGRTFSPKGIVAYNEIVKPVDYNFTDETFERHAYYRVVLVDEHGNQKVSNTVHLSLHGSADPSVFVSPNPTQNQFELTFREIERNEWVEITLTDLSGKIMYSNHGPAYLMEQYFNVASAAFPAGVYALQSKNQRFRAITRLVKHQ